MNLLLDIGNTNIKWRICDQTQRIADGCLPVVESADENLMAAIQPHVRELHSVAVAPTGADRYAQAILSRLEKAQALRVKTASTQKSAYGIDVVYDDASRLGVDRWLAMIAASRLVDSNVIVIDAGTAVTVDFLRADGAHLGGWIAPGIALQRGVLLNRTDKVLWKEAAHASLIGTSTESSVQSGCTQSVVGLIDRAAIVATDLFDSSPSLFVTGGDALLIKNATSRPIEHRDNMVLDGLGIWLTEQSG